MVGSLDREIERVLKAKTCSGCGACCLIDPDIRMVPDDDGFLRPERSRLNNDEGRNSVSTADRTRAQEFRRVCPGLTVQSTRRKRASTVLHDDTIGSHLAVWAAWAKDPAFRERGSSGGVLSALSAWLVETNQCAQVLGAAPQVSDPRTTVPLEITTREEALAAAGSRYAPVAVGSRPSAISAGGAVVGKPCEASALRALSEERQGDAPLILSFLCAGTPSQRATDKVLDSIGIETSEPLSALWYRGRGWPGRFTAVVTDGLRTASTSYEESWGRHLGPAVQWRCKICPDGVGEASDITACDYWDVDARGYPVFAEALGRSGLIARTERGLDVVNRAVEAGVIEVEPLSADAISRVQPYQRNRRSALAGRLVGSRLAGRAVPTYRGFGFARVAMRDLRLSLRSARGTFRRIRGGS